MTGNAVNRTNQESTMSSSAKGLRRSPSSSARNAPALPETPVLYRIPVLEEPAPVSMVPVASVSPPPPPPSPASAERAEEPSVELPPADSSKANTNQRRRRRPRPDQPAEPKRGWDPGSKFLAGGIFLVLLLMLLTYLLARNNRSGTVHDLETTEDLAAVLQEPSLPESTLVEPIDDPEKLNEVIRPRSEPVAAKTESPPAADGPALLLESPPAPSPENGPSSPPTLAEDGGPALPPTEQSVLARRSEPGTDLGLDGPTQTAATSGAAGESGDEAASTAAERPNWATDFADRVQANPHAATGGTSNSPPGRSYPDTGYAPYQFELALDAIARSGAASQAPRMTMREGVYGASPPSVPQHTSNPPPTYNSGYQAPPLR